jgi:hypothetical protein
MLDAAARQWPQEIPFTFTNPRGLSTVEREAGPAEVALHAAALPGLIENDKVMSDQYEACPKE